MPPTLVLLPLTIAAGLLAFVLLWARARSEPAGARLVAEMFVSTLALFALFYGLWMAAQRLAW